MKTLYFECVSGISGDMTVAALLDLGADRAALEKGLSSLKVTGYHLKFGRTVKSGITAYDFNVVLEEEHHHSHGDHDRDHDHSHAHEHPHDHGHEHLHSHEHHHHSHDHDHSHHDHSHNHAHDHFHRNLGDIEKIILDSDITDNAKNIALDIFRVVANAEAKVHGLPVEQVHFHEVGAVDSIVDIVGAAICIDNLKADRIICSPLREGTGTVKCQHGIMPVPAPATMEIIRAHNIPLIITDNSGEMVTPTGAAIIAALAGSFDKPSQARVLGVGYGAGKKEFKVANILRAILLEEAGEVSGDVAILECNLDDITGEVLGYACEILLDSGALDVWTVPAQMKKGRPGYVLSVLCSPDDADKLAELILTHTTTIGVRKTLSSRYIMERRSVTIKTEYGDIPAKESWKGNACKYKPEFDVVKKIAQEKNVPVSQILKAAYNGKKS